MVKKLSLLIALVVLAGGGYYMFQKSDAPTPTIAPVVTPGVTDTEILLGSSAALSGMASRLGTNLISGATVAIHEINDAGGINGRKLRMISYDDQYDPPKAVENTQKLINEDKVFALFNYVGTPTGVKVVPIVAEAQIPLVGMFTGANAFREPLQKYIFNIRGSYYQETELAVQYFAGNLGLEKIAIFYQADAFGLDGQTGAKKALTKRGLQPVAEGSYERGTTHVEDAALAIASSDADAVIMIGTYTPLAKFVKLVKEKKPDMLFHTVSFVGSEAFVKELASSTKSTKNVFITEVVPPYEDGGSFDAVKKYTEGLVKYASGTAPTFGGLEGYVNTKVLAEGLKATGKDLTRENFIATLESFKDYDVGIGANVSFSAANHQGLNKVYLASYEGDKFVIVPVK